MSRVISKISMVSIFAFLLSSCGNSKSTNDAHGLMAEGVVKVSDKTGECALVIESKKAESNAGFYPVNLDDQFRQNNLKIAFNFNLSRAPLPQNCEDRKSVV